MLPLVLLLLVRSAACTDIKGKVGLSVDGFNVVALKPGTVTELLLTDGAGQQLRTFADKEGWFTVQDVPAGSYVLTTYNPMFVYPEVYVDVTAKAGLARASYVFNKQQVMVKPFIIRPAVQAQYYELRKPLDIWGMVKSPYGLMLGFMLFGIVVFPMLKVDPEEYREAMSQLRGDQGGQQPQPRIRDH